MQLGALSQVYKSTKVCLAHFVKGGFIRRSIINAPSISNPLVQSTLQRERGRWIPVARTPELDYLWAGGLFPWIEVAIQENFNFRCIGQSDGGGLLQADL